MCVPEGVGVSVDVDREGVGAIKLMKRMNLWPVFILTHVSWHFGALRTYAHVRTHTQHAGRYLEQQGTRSKQGRKPGARRVGGAKLAMVVRDLRLHALQGSRAFAAAQPASHSALHRRSAGCRERRFFHSAGLGQSPALPYPGVYLCGLAVLPGHVIVP